MNDHERFADPDETFGSLRKQKADPTRCRWRIWHGFSEYQCNNKPKIDGLWCGVHSPEAFARRRKKRDERWAAEDKARAARRAEQDRLYGLRTAAVEALREIAKGELNDPAGYAAMILAEHSGTATCSGCGITAMGHDMRRF